MTILPEILKCKEFVNADSIAAGLSPFSPDNVSFQAGRLMLKRIKELLVNKETFAIETTLTTLSYINLIKEAKKDSYKIVLVYFWLENVKLANQRIIERVKKGGHMVEKEIVKRRYNKGLKNLFSIFVKISDEWIMFDNSGTSPTKIAEKLKGIDIKIHNRNIWKELKNNYEKSKTIIRG
jgi:predicted ABC-type ATPase